MFMLKASAVVVRYSRPASQMVTVLASRSILDNAAVNVRDRAEAYRSSGWKNFDESTSGMSAEEIRRQRESYMR